MGETFSLISPETGFLVTEEIKIFLMALLLGLCIGLYLCIKYSIVKALNIKGFVLGVCDFISVVLITAAVFCFCLEHTFGNVRFYIAAASAIGLYIFKKIFYKSLDRIFSFLLLPVSLASGRIKLRGKGKKEI